MDFVTFETAKKLKEKGFNWKVNAYYGKHENIFDVHPAMDMNDCEYRCSSPTISQVLKWLREEKRIDAGAVWDNRDGKWVGYINEMDMPDLVGEYVLPNTHDTYEAATIASIEYVLDNLI
jgi:hypothetical protein